jgi:hypothetical protein
MTIPDWHEEITKQLDEAAADEAERQRYDIRQLRLRKRELRNNLCRIVFEEIERFKQETGISVKWLSAHFIDATDFTDEFPQYVLAGIDIDLAAEL